MSLTHVTPAVAMRYLRNSLGSSPCFGRQVRNDGPGCLDAQTFIWRFPTEELDA